MSREAIDCFNDKYGTDPLDILNRCCSKIALLEETLGARKFDREIELSPQASLGLDYFLISLRSEMEDSLEEIDRRNHSEKEKGQIVPGQLVHR